jgi:flagellar biosynthesis/type III secretory pathway protein FliH
MQEWAGTILIVGALFCATMAFIWVAVRLGSKADRDQEDVDYVSQAERSIDVIFTDEFREELRNRGRLHFEKIISENAMFLQQDLRLTTSQINEHMKQEINKTLQEAFTKYEESIEDAKEIALESIKKTQSSVEEQRETMERQLKEAIEQEKKRLIERFEKNMADIVNHYVLNAIGGQITLDDQLEYILDEMERNKKDMVKDIESGA